MKQQRGVLQPREYKDDVSPETIAALVIPSAIMYQEVRAGKLPVLSSGSDEQRRRDAATWLSTFDSTPSYIFGTASSSGDATEDLRLIVNGFKVTGGEKTAEGVAALLAPALPFVPSERFIALLYSHPLNPAAELDVAISLLSEPNSVQLYLDRKSVTIFSAQDLRNLSLEETLFFLTRFYGPPTSDFDLEVQAEGRRLLTAAPTVEAAALAREISTNPDLYVQYRDEFRIYYDFLSTDSGNPDIWNSLGVTSRNRFINSFFSYLPLLSRENIPPLESEILYNRDYLTTLFTNYTDEEIQRFLGQVLRGDTRQELIDEAVDAALTVVFHPISLEDADQCINPEVVASSPDVVLGFGRPGEKLRCLDVQRTFSLWRTIEKDRGRWFFANPFNLATEFTTPELQQMVMAIQLRGLGEEEGRRFSREIIREASFFLTESRLKDLENADLIFALRNWANRSPENSTALMNYLVALHQLGHYIKGWKGPGNMYRTRGNYNEETVLGAMIKVAETRKKITNPDVRFMEVIDCSSTPCTIKDETIDRLFAEVRKGNVDVDDAAPLFVDSAAYYSRHVLSTPLARFER